MIKEGEERVRQEVSMRKEKELLWNKAMSELAISRSSMTALTALNDTFVLIQVSSREKIRTLEEQLKPC
jgi:hypothetical protein